MLAHSLLTGPRSAAASTMTSASRTCVAAGSDGVYGRRCASVACVASFMGHEQAVGEGGAELSCRVVPGLQLLACARWQLRPEMREALVRRAGHAELLGAGSRRHAVDRVHRPLRGSAPVPVALLLVGPVLDPHVGQSAEPVGEHADA